MGKRPSTKPSTSLRQRVGRERARRPHDTRALGAEGGAIRQVEVPGAALGPPVLHEDSGLPPHLAVEELHSQLPAPGGVRGELLGRAQKVPVGPDLEARHGAAKLLPHAPLARLDHDHLHRVQRAHRIRELRSERRLGELDVLDLEAAGAKLLAEVPHGGEEQRDARAMRGDVLGFRGRLRHEDPVVLRIEAVESGRFRIELVAQHHDEMAQPVHGKSSSSLFRR